MLGERVGFGRNCNRASEYANREFLVFLNQDVTVGKHWDEPVLSSLKKESIGAVGVKLIYPYRKIQHCGVVFSPFFESIHIYRNFPENFGPSEKEREFQAVTGALLGIRKDVFERFKFSEEYFFYYEDTDLCFRLRDAGLKILYIPYTKCTHIESSSVPEDFIHTNLQISREIFLKKWKHKIISDELLFYLEDGQIELFLKKAFKYLRKMLKRNLRAKLSKVKL